MVIFKLINFRVLLYLPVSFIILAVVVSCESNDADPVFTGHDYFGMKENKWLIYQVDSTVYDDFLGEVFHYNYQVKEINAGFFNDASGNISMRVEKFIRMDESQKWKIKNVSTAAIRGGQALATEDNITRVKLVFPLRRNRIWNGNAFNNKDFQEYRITSIHEPLNEGQLSFDSTLTVLQKNFITLIGEDYQYEVYAAGTGMIKKHFTSLEKEIDGTVKRGVDYTFTLVDRGYLH
jgi:hypothetical protein